MEHSSKLAENSSKNISWTFMILLIKNWKCYRGLFGISYPLGGSHFELFFAKIQQANEKSKQITY